MPGIFFTHIFAPYAVGLSSAAHVEMSLVYGSWQRAAATAAESGIAVEFLGCTLEKDRGAVPGFARASSPLTYYAVDAKNGVHELPTIGGIWDKGAAEGLGRYLVYTNMDIGVQENFYVGAHDLLSRAEAARAKRASEREGPETTTGSGKTTSRGELPWTALEFTRVQSARIREPPALAPTLDAVLAHSPIGRHPGHDCFVVPRHLVPSSLRSGGLVVGMPPWGTMYHYALMRDDRLELLFLQGTAADRYTFHTGVEGTVESWLDNQDFRLQQYSEAFRIFGPEVASRAWGAKGKSSPFYFMCNGTSMRYPACDFCDAFYPSSLYPDASPLARRECKGLVTDRPFYSHLPVPVRTEVSDLSRWAEKQSAKKGKDKGGKQSAEATFGTYASGDGDSLGRVFGRAEPCKVKCQAERLTCGRVGSRAGVSPGLRATLAHRRPPLLWSYGETGGWARLVIEHGLGHFTGSVLLDSAAIGDAVSLRHDSSAAPSAEASCDHGGAAASGPLLVAMAAVDGGEDGTAPGRFLGRLSPACFGLRRFDAAVVVARNPFTAIWADFHRKWTSARLSSGGSASPVSVGQAARLAFSFMSDAEVDHFAHFALKSSRAWASAHGDVLQAMAAAPASVHVVRHEALARDDESAAAALDGLAKFLGVVGTPGSKRAHCARLLASRATESRELSMVQAETSMDQLFEGKLVCKMWVTLHRQATGMGYPEPFNRMPCDHAVASDTASGSAKGDTAKGGLEGQVEVAPCGWFQWGQSRATLHDWVSACAGEPKSRR